MDDWYRTFSRKDFRKIPMVEEHDPYPLQADSVFLVPDKKSNAVMGIVRITVVVLTKSGKILRLGDVNQVDYVDSVEFSVDKSILKFDILPKSKAIRMWVTDRMIKVDRVGYDLEISVGSHIQSYGILEEEL